MHMYMYMCMYMSCTTYVSRTRTYVTRTLLARACEHVSRLCEHARASMCLVSASMRVRACARPFAPAYALTLAQSSAGKSADGSGGGSSSGGDGDGADSCCGCDVMPALAGGGESRTRQAGYVPRPAACQQYCGEPGHVLRVRLTADSCPPAERQLTYHRPSRSLACISRGRRR